MAVLKLSQISTTSANPATTDYSVSVVSGSTDILSTYAQVGSTLSPIITLVSSQIPSINASVITIGTLSSAVLPAINVSTTGAGGITGSTLNNTVLSSSLTSLGTVTGLTASTVLITSSGTASTPSLGIGGPSTGFYSSGASGFGIIVNGTSKLDCNISINTDWSFAGSIVTNNAIILGANGSLGWAGRAGGLLSLANNTIQIGGASSSTPAAQTLLFTPGGGTNISGQNATIIGSLGTGSATSGNLIFQVGSGAGSSGTSPNTATTAMTIASGTRKVAHTAPITLPLFTVTTVNALTGSATGDVAVVTDALLPVLLSTATGGGTSVAVVLYNGTAWVIV